MLTVRIQEKNYSESIMVLKLKDGEKNRYRSLILGLNSNQRIVDFEEEACSQNKMMIRW